MSVLNLSSPNNPRKNKTKYIFCRSIIGLFNKTPELTNFGLASSKTIKVKRHISKLSEIRGITNLSNESIPNHHKPTIRIKKPSIPYRLNKINNKNEILNTARAKIVIGY
ncbi:MAG: hypothetical protein STSR0008_12190 [Ignavibacterium sp.]